MLKQLHLAAQYLAMAGKSYVAHAPDDSHTNLAWDESSKRLLSRNLGNTSIQVSVCYISFSLEVLSDGKLIDKLELHSLSHTEVLQWLTNALEQAGLEGDYLYDLHYDIPYSSTVSTFRFELISHQEVQKVASYLTLAQKQFSLFLQQENLNSEVRVWPHHFDLGAYATISDYKNRSLGIGLAIPDSLVADFYIYVSGWENGKAIPVKGFTNLTYGKWHANWAGAVMPISEASEETILPYLKEALTHFKAYTSL